MSATVEPANDSTGSPGDSQLVNSNILSKFNSSFSPWGDYVFGSVMLVIGLVSLLGNSLAVHVFRRREINAPETLLLNIALVDLFLAVVSYPAAIVASFSHGWIFGEIGCTAYGAVCFFFGIATILSLTILAVFRLLKLTSHTAGQWMTVDRTRFILLPLVYVYSAGWAFVPLFNWSGYDVEPFGLSCTLDWKKPELGSKIYLLMVSVFCVGLPMLTIIGCHVGIFFKIKQANKMFMDRSLSKQSSKAEIEFIRVSIGVCFGFVIAWLPYAVLSLWSAFGDSSSIPIWITPIPVLLAKSSIAYNPIIYVLMTKRYRSEFSKALREAFQNSNPTIVTGNASHCEELRQSIELNEAIKPAANQVERTGCTSFGTANVAINLTQENTQTKQE